MSEKIQLHKIADHLNKLAPPGLSAEWDNVGLQLGEMQQEISRILLTLDVTEKAIEYAIRQKSDLIISHHPLIFRPLKSITDTRLLRLIRENIAVFTLHTNLDSAKQGVNHALARRLGLQDLEFLSGETGAQLYQLSVYVPPAASDAVSRAIFRAGAGEIGNYKSCMSYYPVAGQFISQSESKPVIGIKGEVQKVSELKLEFFVDSFNLSAAIRALKENHPYEQPVYTVIPQQRASDNYGLGLIGKLPVARKLLDFAQDVKVKLSSSQIKLWPGQEDMNKFIQKVAVCGGSGSSLLSMVAGRADVFVSADFTYHTILDSRIPLIDAGHFHTEYPVLELLEESLGDLGIQLEIFPRDQHEINKLTSI